MAMTNWSKIREILRSDPDGELRDKRFKKSARNRGLHGSNTYGAASRVRRLSGDDLEKRKAELEQRRQPR